ncbi:MAG: RNA polymerase sigma factor [Chitinophagaceae bacterium]|nr:RNA polymerase sigma factor [Chitinophagaceae bacterium]
MKENNTFERDSHLILLCKKGNRDAQFQLYNHYSKAMFHIAYRILGNKYDAEDVLQDSFVSVFQNLETYRGDSTFGAWLKRIVINKSLNQIRIKSKKQDCFSPEEYLERTEESVDEETISMSIEKVKKAVLLLPDGFRAVFTLYLFEGYDHKEIAQLLNITESTSKSQLNRAKEKLRTILKEFNVYG